VIELSVVDDRRRRIDLQVAGRYGPRRTQYGKAASERIILRQHQIEPAEQRIGKARRAPPTAKGTPRDATVDERQGNAARGAFKDQVRPNLRFGENRQIRPPMVEEARHELRRIERRVLMDRARTEPQ